MTKSGIKHILTTVPVPQSEFIDEEFHGLVHGTSFPGSPVERQLFYRNDLSTLYIYNGTSWVSMQVAAIDNLNDIGDVNVPSPTNKQGILYDTGTSKWILTDYMLSKLLTARGDIITRNASVPKRLTLGTAGYYLKAGANEPEWAAAPVLTRLVSKVKEETRDMEAASGSVSYTGYGFQPTAIDIQGVVDATKIAFWGQYDGTTGKGIYMRGDDGNIRWTGFPINLREDASNGQRADFSSFDADGFTLAWLKTGTPSAGTATLRFHARR